MEMLANAIVVKILQYISGANQRIVHLTFTQWFMSTASQGKMKNDEGK